MHDTTLIVALLIPFWGLALGLLALKQRDTRRALGFLVPSGVMLLFILAVNLADLQHNPALITSDAAEASAPASTPANPVQQELLAAANNVTSNAPRMIDADTRLDGAFVGPGLTFTYLYTLPKVVSPLQPGYFSSKLVPNIKKAGCASRQLQAFFEHEVVVVYKYRANDGTELGSVAMSKKLCPRKPLPPKAPASAPAAQAASAPAAEPAPPPEPTALPESLSPPPPSRENTQ